MLYVPQVGELQRSNPRRVVAGFATSMKPGTRAMGLSGHETGPFTHLKQSETSDDLQGTSLWNSYDVNGCELPVHAREPHTEGDDPVCVVCHPPFCLYIDMCIAAAFLARFLRRLDCKTLGKPLVAEVNVARGSAGQ